MLKFSLRIVYAILGVLLFLPIVFEWLFGHAIVSTLS